MLQFSWAPNAWSQPGPWRMWGSLAGVQTQLPRSKNIKLWKRIRWSGMWTHNYAFLFPWLALININHLILKSKTSLNILFSKVATQTASEYIIIMRMGENHLIVGEMPMPITMSLHIHQEAASQRQTNACPRSPTPKWEKKMLQSDESGDTSRRYYH